MNKIRFSGLNTILFILFFSSCYNSPNPTKVVDNFYKTVAKKNYFYVGMSGDDMDKKVLICDAICDWYRTSLWHCSSNDFGKDTIEINEQLFIVSGSIMTKSNKITLDGNETAVYVSYIFQPLTEGDFESMNQTIIESFTKFHDDWDLVETGEALSVREDLIRFSDSDNGYFLVIKHNKENGST